ncbi:MAG: gliding motility-associated C-terminal domain-containing protein, partial [Bacteroidota bacterium]
GDADDSDYEDVFEDLTEYDLALIKTANDIDFWVWDTVTYTITVANQGNVNSNTFTVMDSIPTGMAFVDADNGGAENSGAVIWNLANLLPGETVDLTVRMRFTDGSLTPFVNWAEITDDSADDYRTTDEDSTPDSDSTNDQLNDHDDITLDEPPLDEDDSDVETVRVNVAEYDLALIKTADLSQAGMGDQVPYTITVANQGNIPSKDFLVIDVIPAGMSYVSSDNGGWLDGDTVKWVVADLLPGDMIDLRVTLQVDDVSLGTFSNWAEIRDDSSEDYGMTDIDSRPNGSPDDDVIDHDDITQDQVPNDEDDSDFEDVEPIPLEYDLALIKTANPLSAGFGDAVTYVITVANQGNLNSNDFTVIDILPQGMSFLTADNGGVLNGDTVVWTIANLEPDSLIELRVRLQVDDVSNGTFRNWAEISDDSSEDYGLTDDDSTPDSDPTNDWANDHDIITIDGAAGDEDDSDYEDVFPIPMEYDLALIKTANVSEVGSGDEVRFTITVANQGSLDAHDFTVVDLIPNGMSFVSADNGAVEFGGVVTWIIPDLEPGETIDLTVTLRADNTLLGSFRNWAEISDDSSEDYGLTDDDSTPDADPNDDANDHDDITLDDAAGDEDDSDFETIIAIDPGLEPDTIYVTTEYNTPITDICADVSDLPGNYGYTLRCGDPANGFLQVNSLSNCVNYTPDVGFVGVDEACIQVCDDSSPSVCDTVYIIITVEATGCTDFITDATMEGYADACDELLAVCVEIPFAEVSDYRITDNGVAYTNTFEACADDPNNLQLSLESGYHLLNFFDLRTGCQDSLAVTISCPLDSTIRNTVRLDEDNEICFDGFMEGEIISIENTCPESAGNATIVVDTNTNCVIYTGVEVGLDTSCIKICVAPDSCTLYTVVTTVVPACETIFNNDSLVTFTEECDSLARVCLDVPIAEFLLEYGLVHNDGTYDGRFEGCDFDSVVTYTYFTIPDRGASGPYNVDSWMVNGNFYSGQFEDLQSLVDSMNRWDSSSEWFINDNTFLLAGGDPGNIYGDLRISQIGTGRSTRLNENRLFLPNGSAIFLPVGQHEIVLRNVDTGCRDTLAIDVLCVGIDVVYDTITVYNIDTLCLDTLELPGTVVSIDNYCDDSSGEYVSYDIIDDGPCLEIEGIDIGQDSACVVICDDLGNCDTTFIFVMVLPQMIDAVNDADTLIENATEFTKDILRNDTISGQLDTIYLVDNPDHGAVTLNEDGTITYIPNEGYCDSQIPDSVSYAICNMVGCDTATVYFYVFCDDLEIYTGFSPNEDGNNDVFLIDGIEGYPNNTLTIFNRWGNQVYFTRGYLNTWNGKWNGKDLPDGTYFYILDDGQGRTFTGYVQIHR